MTKPYDLFLALFLALFSQPVFADEYGFELGTLLPNQIPGLTEIMPTWGAHYAWVWGPGLLDTGFINSNANGSSYSAVNFGFRWGEELYAGVGVMAHYYSRRDEPQWQARLIGGGYGQLGAVLSLSDYIFVDGNFRFFVNPGTVLYMAIGITYRY